MERGPRSEGLIIERLLAIFVCNMGHLLPPINIELLIPEPMIFRSP